MTVSEVSTVESGFLSQIVPVKSEDSTFRLTRWFTAPVKVKLASWPGVPMLPLAGDPERQRGVRVRGSHSAVSVTFPLARHFGSMTTL